MADAGEIKNINRDAVRRVLKQEGTMSKNSLARATGLSFSTVGRMVDALVADGELLEHPARAASTGGRCAKLYSLEPAFQVTLSLRFEARELNWFVNDLLGNCLESGTEHCHTGTLQAIDTLLVRVQARYPQLGAIVMGFAGTVFRGTVTEEFGSDELRGVNLLAHLKDKSKLPVAVEGDMAVVSIGYCSRCAVQPKAVVCIYWGRQCIGAGVVIEGSPWRGASEFAGEVHYLPFRESDPPPGTPIHDDEVVDCYARIIRSYAALLNPDRVVLYNNPRIDGKADAIRMECAKHLPTHVIPQFELSEDFALDYAQGLIFLAYDLLGRP